jgi:hypothetical protein
MVETAHAESETGFSSFGIVLISGMVLLHIAAFGFWLYKFATTSDKPTMSFKQNVD